MIKIIAKTSQSFLSARYSSTEIHISTNEQKLVLFFFFFFFFFFNISYKCTQTVFSKYSHENHIRNISLSLKNNKTTLTEID